MTTIYVDKLFKIHTGTLYQRNIIASIAISEAANGEVLLDMSGYNISNKKEICDFVVHHIVRIYNNSGLVTFKLDKNILSINKKITDTFNDNKAIDRNDSNLKNKMISIIQDYWRIMSNIDSKEFNDVKNQFQMMIYEIEETLGIELYTEG